MTDQMKNYMILSSLLISVLTFFAFGLKSCHDADMEFKLMKRDSLMQRQIDTLESQLPELEHLQYLYENRDTVIQRKIIQTQIKYKEREKEFNNLPINSSYRFVKSKLQERIRTGKK